MVAIARNLNFDRLTRILNECETITWKWHVNSNATICLKHTLSTRRHFNVNYHQISWIGCFVTRFYISREMKCLIQWILLSSVTSAFFTIVWTLFGIICHTYTHEQTSKHTCNWGIVVSNPINKTNWTVIYDQNFKMMISTLYSSCCLAFRLMT